MNESLSTERVAETLLSFVEEEYDWRSYGEFTNYALDPKGKSWNVPGLGLVTIVDYQDYDQDKNYSGWSEQLWIVFDVAGTLYRATGTYTSYIGSEWNEKLTIVQPKTVEVIVYE